MSHIEREAKNQDSSMEIAEHQEDPEPPSSPPSIHHQPPPLPIIVRLISKRRTWVILFISVYTLLLCSSWSILTSVLSWHRRRASGPNSTSTSTFSLLIPSLYASAALGAVFGLLAMAAALAVAVPATVVTWITVLVLLAFCGRPRRDLVAEGRKLTGEIVGFAARVLIREGNCVAVVCAVFGYFFLVKRSGEYGD